MKKIFFLFLVSVSFSAFAQQATVIDHLDFPYNLNYQLRLKGEVTVYNQKTGDVENTKNSEVIYNIDKQTVDKKGSLTNFHVIQISAHDSLKSNSPLVLNKKGMKWWMGDSNTGMKEKHKTQAIKLPLYTGKTYLNDHKVVAKCVSTSTSIETPCGTFDVFEVEMTMVVEKTSTYEVIIKLQEYYNQKIGKVADFTQTYAIVTGSGFQINVAKDEDRLIYYTGYKKE